MRISNEKLASLSVHPDATVAEAMGLMRTEDSRFLFVLEGGKLVGMLDWEVFRSFEPPFPLVTLVREVMEKNPPSVETDSDLKQVVRLMLEGGHSVLPLRQEGQLVGLVTERDLVAYLDRLLNGRSPLGTVIETGEALMANSIVQSIVHTLGDAGI